MNSASNEHRQKDREDELIEKARRHVSELGAEIVPGQAFDEKDSEPTLPRSSHFIQLTTHGPEEGTAEVGSQDPAALKRNIEPDEIGKTAVFLVSRLSSGVTGENIFVDSGYNIIGL